jgi:hypothetical protein
MYKAREMVDYHMIKNRVDGLKVITGMGQTSCSFAMPLYPPVYVMNDESLLAHTHYRLAYDSPLKCLWAALNHRVAKREGMKYGGRC